MALPNKRFSKVIMILFLIMIVLGFSIPLVNIGNNPAGENDQNQVEPRLCQTDADCYLLCEDKPVEVLCSQNLCQQNGCEEAALYPYAAAATTFTLSITVQGKGMDLVNRSNSKDLFVQFKDSTADLAPDSAKDSTSSLVKSTLVSVHSFEFPLALILEKLNIGLTSECLFLGKYLFLGKDKYCQDEQHQLRLLVNGEESFRYGEYVPVEVDKVEIEYG
jgi:hypothetical protein